MKGPRLILLIASILLLTFSSGLLFYKNLFLFETPGRSGKVDFDELRYTDLQINVTASMLRKNISDDHSALEVEITRIKELINIVTDVNRSSIDLLNSIKKIEDYFNKKISNLKTFQIALKELKLAVDAINPAYNELNKNNIKFTVDKRDFYRECVIDSLLYVATSSRDNELRLQEDKKILGQIVSFATTPNPIILKFSNLVDVILKKTKELDELTEIFSKDSSINSELSLVGKHYREAQEAKTHDGEIFLTMVFGAIVLYLICIAVILKKLT